VKVLKSIFVSYRRSDAPHEAGRLYDRLALEFGESRVYRDQDSTAGGADYVSGIPARVAASGVLIAVIGARWVTAEKERRAGDERDWVRFEISEALKRGIPVVPVLVNGAAIPTRDELPDDIKALADRQAVPLTEQAWSSVARDLIASLRRRLAPPLIESPAATVIASVAASALVGLVLTELQIRNPIDDEASAVLWAAINGAGLSLALVAVVIAAGLSRWPVALALLSAFAIGALTNSPMGKIQLQDTGDLAFVYGVGFGLSALAALLPTNSWTHVTVATALGVVGGGIAAQIEPSASALYGAATYGVVGACIGAAIAIATAARPAGTRYAIE
jgi:hypothetical protein